MNSSKNKEESLMAFKIGEGCISCGTCAENCPVGAVSEGDDSYVIDADACISCGTCAENCPMGVIAEE